MTDQSADQDARTRTLKVFYFRHGETAWSLARRHTGRTDLPLTAHGEDQARALKPWVEASIFSRVLSSPRLRARRTCELAGVEESVEISPDLAEWDYGDYDGRRSEDITREIPSWDLFRDGCPNGESPEQVGERADRVIARLRAMEDNVAVFSHGQFGAVFAARWIGLVVEEARHFALRPASLSIMKYDPDHSQVPVIALWNASPEAGEIGIS